MRSLPGITDSYHETGSMASETVQIEEIQIHHHNSYEYITSDTAVLPNAERLGLYSPQEKESNYWIPSNEEEELIMQLEKLKLKIFEERALE